MSFGAVHYSSQKNEWETPQAFFDGLDREFGFTLDVAALPENAKCQRYFTPDDDGLKREWSGVVWCNPPYGKDVGLWVRRAAESRDSGVTSVVLVFARTDTAWWHDWAAKADEIRFVRGRLKFGGCKNSAPSPSAVLVFRGTERTNG